MDPRSVGVPSSQLVVGKHSGRHAIADRCTHLGYNLTTAQLDAIYHRVIAVCDKKKWLSDQEIGDIAHSVVES
jgi:2-isopropylmalate synthase